jgi:hypothetical protein
MACLNTTPSLDPKGTFARVAPRRGVSILAANPLKVFLDICSFPTL